MGGVNSCVGSRPRHYSHRKGKSKKPYDKKSKKNMSAAFNLHNTDVNIDQLNINQASEEELMTLTGIDRVTAHNIVEHRRQIGAFKRVEDLALVSGVGATKLTQIRMEICVNRKKHSENSSIDSSNDFDNISKCSMKSRASLMPSKVNVNKANVFQLMKVKGVSQQLAQNVVAYRDKKGLYRTLDELTKVKGISHSVLSAIRPLLVLQDEDLVNLNSHYQSNGMHSLHPSQIFTHNRSMSYTNGCLQPIDPNMTTMTHTRHNTFSHHITQQQTHSMDDMLHAVGPLGKKSYRPKCEPVSFYRNSRPIVRMATWNLQQCGCEKAENPGVKEVIAMTVLENGISLLAVQELTDAESLQKICDELNRPTIPSIKNFEHHSGYWKCLVSGNIDSTGQKQDHLGFLYDSSRGIEMKQCHLVDFPDSSPTTSPDLSHTHRDFTNSGSDISAHTPLVEEVQDIADSVHLRQNSKVKHRCNSKAGAFFVNFRMDSWQFCAVNMCLGSCTDCKPRIVSSGCDSGVPLTDLCQEHCDTILSYSERHSQGMAVVYMGSINANKKSTCGLNCTVSYGNTHSSNTGTTKQRCCQDKIWLQSTLKNFYTEEHGIVDHGLHSQWIPKGSWSWGGTVSDHLPVWCEVYADGGKVSSDLQLLLKSVGLSVGQEKDMFL